MFWVFIKEKNSCWPVSLLFCFNPQRSLSKVKTSNKKSKLWSNHFDGFDDKFLNVQYVIKQLVGVKFVPKMGNTSQPSDLTKVWPFLDVLTEIFENCSVTTLTWSNCLLHIEHSKNVLSKPAKPFCQRLDFL